MPLSLGYVKGSARLVTLHALLSGILTMQLDNQRALDLFPKILLSARCLYFYVQKVADKKDLIMANFAQSYRSSIRQAPNVITWITVLMKVAKEGVVPGALILEWNAGHKANALTGNKAAAVKTVMERMPLRALQLVVEEAGREGWSECPWTEEALASKKIYPGSVFKHSGKQHWVKYGQVTEASVEIMVAAVHVRSRMKIVQLRKKVPKKDVEELAEVAAMVDALRLEVLRAAPVPVDRLEKEFVQPFCRGDQAVLLELEIALHEKSEKFTYQQISVLSGLVREHLSTNSKKRESAAQQKLDA